MGPCGTRAENKLPILRSGSYAGSLAYYQTNEREEEELRNEWTEQLQLPPDESSAGLWNEVREMREHASS